MARTKAEEKARRDKIRRDGRALSKYRERLENTYKSYIQTFDAYAINQRKSREAALGACALKAIDTVRGLAKANKLASGSVEYVINEQKLADPDGKIGFHYVVAFKAVGTEKAYNDEEINKEIMDTFERMMMETDEMFPEEKDDEEAETEGDAERDPG